LAEKFGELDVEIIPDGTGGVRFDFTRASGIPFELQKDVERLYHLVMDWGRKPGDAGVMGMDTLRRKLDEFTSVERKTNLAAADLATMVRKDLQNNIPGYEEMTRDYAIATKLIREMEKELSMGRNATIGATMRKLSTVISRDGDYRQSLVQLLDAETLDLLSDQLAGYELSQFTPKTLVGRGMAATILGVGAIKDPKILLNALINSPRLVGEVLVALGRIHQIGGELTELGKIPVSIFSEPAIYRPPMLTPPDVSGETPDTLFGPPPPPPQVGQ